MRQPIEDVIRQYQKNLFAIAFNICKNTEDANDIVQETFIKYHQSKIEYKDEAHLYRWLIRVAINKAKDVTRSFWRRNSVPYDEYMESTSLEQNDEQILDEVMSLPQKYRIVIHLFYYESLSVKEISEILKTSEASVKMRLSRGRNLLKTLLKGEES